MKIAHWSIFNKSGMYRVAESLATRESQEGLTSILVNPQDSSTWGNAIDADIHVAHTHFPDTLRKKVSKPLKIVHPIHGTPEHIFQSAVEEGTNKGYGHGDGFMLVQNWLRTADAVVTFWPRHQAIWQSMCPKERKIHYVPMGVDKEFWKPVPSPGKYAGNPSVLTAENAHSIKWPLDLFMLWPWVYPEVDGAVLHSYYLPRDMHRWFFPLVNANGCSYGAHISPIALDPEGLRNTFSSVDFYIGLVRYGDFNRISLEANACGVKTISYAGNPYSDFWVNEGDQREIAKQLIAILKGQVEPRNKEVVPDISETVKEMIKIYESVL